MSQSNLTSNEFAQLIQKGSRTELNAVSSGLCEKMELYLKAVMRADAQVAQDCAHAAFEKVYIKVKTGEIKDLDNFYGYCIRSARNELLMHKRSSSRVRPLDSSGEEKEVQSSAEETIEILHSDEKEEALTKCLSELKPKRKQFFLRILNHINHSDKEAAELLGMTHAQYRTKKSRTIAVLRQCVDRVLGK